VRAHAILGLERLGTSEAHAILRTHLQHEVAIPADESGPRFYIDRYPVTNAAYQTFLEDQPDRDPPPSWHTRSAPLGFANHPVTHVSWEDASAYAAWAGKRLPTVQEWHRAAGGMVGHRYPWGNRFDANRCNTAESGTRDTTAVERYSPAGDSRYGVADMAGNVWEWLADPAGLDGAYRQLRGGAWRYSAEFAQIDYDCFRRSPSMRQDVIGFRLCLSLPCEE
jgi:formylglycine-generating enzyme required for sulfatase activity